MWSVILLALLAPASPAPLTKTPCHDQSFLLQDAWSLPTTALAEDQLCFWTFNISDGYFAVVSVLATDMDRGGFDQVSVDDALGTRDWQTQLNQDSWASKLAWGGQFIISVRSMVGTNMKMAINITLEWNLVTHGAAPSQQITIHTNGPSPVLYPEDLKAGQIIAISSIQNQVIIKPAYWDHLTVDNSLMNNVFIYDKNRTFLGSVLTIDNHQSDRLPSVDSCLLYVAMAPAAPPDTAILIMDSSNLQGVNRLYASYVNEQGGSNGLAIDGEKKLGQPGLYGALTIVGAKDGSTPYNVTKLEQQNRESGTFSYIAGGPQASHTLDNPLNAKALPKRITGNINTFYISQGQGYLYYKL